MQFYGEHAALALYERSLQCRTYIAGVDGCRHDNNLQVGAYYLLRLTGQRKGKVGVDAALVKLVEDDYAHAVERCVVYNHARQNAFSQHFDACTFRHPTLEPDSVSYGFAHLLAKHLRHALRNLSRSQSARLEH